MIHASELNDQLTMVQSSVDYVNGAEVEDLVDKYTLRCKKKTIPSKEAVLSDRLGTTTIARFIVWQVDDFSDTVRWLIRYQGKEWNIISCHEIDENHFELTAEKRS